MKLAKAYISRSLNRFEDAIISMTYNEASNRGKIDDAVLTEYSRARAGIERLIGKAQS